MDSSKWSDNLSSSNHEEDEEEDDQDDEVDPPSSLAQPEAAVAVGSESNDMQQQSLHVDSPLSSITSGLASSPVWVGGSRQEQVTIPKIPSSSLSNEADADAISADPSSLPDHLLPLTPTPQQGELDLGTKADPSILSVRDPTISVYDDFGDFTENSNATQVNQENGHTSSPALEGNDGNVKADPLTSTTSLQSEVSIVQQDIGLNNATAGEIPPITNNGLAATSPSKEIGGLDEEPPCADRLDKMDDEGEFEDFEQFQSSSALAEEVEKQEQGVVESLNDPPTAITDEQDDSDFEDDFGDFNEAPPQSVAESAPSPSTHHLDEAKSLQVVSQASLSSSLIESQTSWPMSKRTQSFFRKAYGDPLHHIAEDNLDDTDRMIALNEEVVALDKNLDQDLRLGRYFEAHANGWSVQILTNALMTSMRDDGTHGEEEEEEEEDEGPESVISITWALASPAPSRPTSVSLQPTDLRPKEKFGFGSNERGEKKESNTLSRDSNQSTPASSRVPNWGKSDGGMVDSVTDVDCDLLGGGASLGGTATSTIDPLSRTFMDFGLGGHSPTSSPHLEATTSPTTAEDEGTSASLNGGRKVRLPLSASAEDFMSILPDFAFMVEKMPRLPHQNP